MAEVTEVRWLFARKGPAAFESDIDFATAALHAELRARNARFIARVESAASAPRTVAGRVLVVPAAFHRQFPRFGGDGRVVREVAERAGLEVDTLPLSGTGTVNENAALLSERLDGSRDRVILVSLSMGGADVRVALESTPALAARVHAWINVSGLLHGSPLLDDLLDARFPSSLLVAGALRAMGGSRRMLPALSAKPGAPLSARFLTPPGLLAVNVVGLPLREHLSGNPAARHARLAPLGPNDGSTLVQGALAAPGLTYPVWGADHYMRAPGVDVLLARLLGLLAGAGETELLGMAA